MNVLAQAALAGWPLAGFCTFTVLRPRLAVLVTYVVGFLFLPMGNFEFSGLPEYNRETATTLAAVLGVLVFDAGRIRSFRPGLLDLPILLWCLAPIPSSITNGLGAYDGFSVFFDRAIAWGLPFLMGRLYFRDAASLRLLAKGVIVAGLLYVPLCLFEIRMSPWLHSFVYGFHQVPFLYLMRGDGYRPIVFLQSGLMVGMLLAAATVMSVWMAGSGSVRRIWSIPVWAAAAAIGVTLLLSKTAGAITLAVVGATFFFAARLPLGHTAFAVMLLVVAAYPPLRISGVLSGDRILAAAESVYPSARVESLGVRLKSEDLMTEKAMRRPAFGWAGWGRSEVHDERGRRIAIPDGLWIIAIGHNGLFGLFSLMATYLLPPAFFLWRHSRAHWTRPPLVPVAAFSFLLVLYWIDSLSNAMLNLVLVLGMGGLTGYHVQRPARRVASRARIASGRRAVARA